MNEPQKEAMAHAAANQLTAALMPFSCMMAAVQALAVAVLFGALIMIIWIWTLPRQDQGDDAKAVGSPQIVDPAKGH